MNITEKSQADDLTNKNIYVYKVSPYEYDEDTDFNNSIHCENVPFRAICIEKEEYIKMRTDTKLLDLEKSYNKKCTEFSMLCEQTTLETKLLLFASGLAIGIATFYIINRLDMKHDNYNLLYPFQVNF